MKDKKLKESVLYIIILVMAFMLIACFTKINSLSREINHLRNDYLSEDDMLREQINSIYTNVDEQLKKQASLITESTFSLGELDTKTQMVPVTIRIVPKEIREDMQIKVELDGEQAEFVKNGSFYEATIPVGLFLTEEPYPMVNITYDGVTKTEKLEEIWLGELWGKWFPLLRAEDTTGRSSFKDGKLAFDTQTLIEWDYLNNVSKIVFENFAIVTEINGKEVKRVDITEEVKNAEGFAEGIVALEFKDTYEVVEGDAVSVYVVAEDSLGYIHKTLAHYWQRSGGASAEAVYGGESVYDKQGNMIYGY